MPNRAGLLFARQFLANPRHVGSLVPSSRALVARMLDRVDWSRVTTAVEYGPGTGVVTRAMLARMRPDARLFAFEINPDFARHLTDHVADPRLVVVPASAELVGAHVPGGCDLVISCLPLTLMPGPVRQRILAATAAALAPGAAMIGYQYSPVRLGDIKAVFGDVQLRLEPRNWPPAVVYIARR